MDIRTFIALELSDEVQKELSRVKGILERTNANVKWFAPETTHITLQFLGNISDEKVPCVEKILRSIASRTAPFDITLNNIEVFPGWTEPKVLWIGIDKGCGPLQILAGSIRAVMLEEGFSEENRPFIPHITIGRIAPDMNKSALRKGVVAIDVKSILAPISRLVFFKSLLTKEGAIHTILSACDLAG
jgi:RNA 2',3'-cyclic 3'-phosphodiesterase